MRLAIHNDSRSGVALAAHAERADGFLARLKGLLGRDGLEEGGGLLLEPCNAIHMFFMKFAIDVLFLDGEHRVVRAISGIRPWSATRAHARAASALELPAGTIARTGTVEGDQLRFESVN